MIKSGFHDRTIKGLINITDIE